MNEKLSIARIFYPVKTLGPGNRVGIWTTGCSRRCAGCISPELQYYDKEKELAVEDIVDMIHSIPHSIDGFTISGGEPFWNSIALDALIQKLVKINDDILIYTGYTLNELRQSSMPKVENILNNCAVLIDGPYIVERNNNCGLRGSSNQCVHIFKYPDKYREYDHEERKVQNVIYGNGILMIGIPRRNCDDECG